MILADIKGGKKGKGSQENSEASKQKRKSGQS